MRRGLALLLVAGSLVSSAIADETRSLRRGDRVLLTGPSCADLRKHAAAFQKIPRVKDPEAAAIPIADCVKSRGGTFWEVDISDFLPIWARAASERIERDGPNCFNMALLTVGLNEQARFCSADEFAACLESPACKAVPAGQNLLPGDVIAFRQGTNDVHSMIYVDEIFAISRNGCSVRAPQSHGVQPADQVFSLYGVPSQCFPQQGQLPTESTSCPVRLFAYRCDGGVRVFTEIEKDSRAGPSLEALRRAECVTSEKLLSESRKIFDGAQRAELVDALSAIDASFRKAEKTESEEKRRNELKLLRLQTESLVRWLRMNL